MISISRILAVASAVVALTTAAVLAGQDSGAPASADTPSPTADAPLPTDDATQTRPHDDLLDEPVHDDGGLVGGDAVGPDTGAELVEPREGATTDPRLRAFETAVAGGDGDTLEVTYWSGVEPCNVLDHVEVDEDDDEIRIGLYEGPVVEHPDDPPVCIEIAVAKRVIVPLDEPQGDRQIADLAKQGG